MVLKTLDGPRRTAVRHGSTLSWALLCAVAAPLTAQVTPEPFAGGPQITVEIRQVAGANVYLDVGQLHGLMTGDTLMASVEGRDAPPRTFVVTAATDRRSVLTSSADASDVTRSDRLTIRLLREPTALPVAEAGPIPTPPPESTVAGVARLDEPTDGGAVARSPHGRFTLEMAAVRSTTRFGSSGPEEIARSFATPALGLDARMPEAFRGFDFRTSLRVAYRYSDRSIVQPATAVRVRTASLRRAFTSVPLELELGRFHSPVENYSGYWDGAMVRVGGPELGVGALVGFEPDRWNESASTEVPKASLFVNAGRDGPSWRWNGDLSVHSVQPRSDGATDHTFVGLSQRLTTRHLLLSQDLQVDRDPVSGGWRISDMRLRGVVPLSTDLDLRLGVARRERYLLWRPNDPFSPQRDRISGGLGYRIGRGYVGMDVSGSESTGESLDTWAWTATFSSPRLPGLPGVAAIGSLSRWGGPTGEIISATPGAYVSLGQIRVRATYRFRRAVFLERENITHGLDFSTDLSLGNGLRGSVRVGGQWGASLRSQTIRLTLYRTF